MADHIPSGHTLQDLFHDFDRFGDAPALIAFDEAGEARVLSFEDMVRRVDALARMLLRRGIGPGVAVALFAGNGIEAVLARLALIRISAVAVPVDADSDGARLRAILADSNAVLLFTETSRLARAAEAMAGLAPEPALVLLDPPGTGAGEKANGERARESLQALIDEGLQLPDPVWPVSLPGAVTARFYTSGTTGTPKAVPLSHRNILTNLKVLSALGLAGPDDRILLPLPLHHAFPFIVGLLLPLMSGATVVFPGGVTGPQLMAALRDGDVTVLVGVPRLYAAMKAGIEGRLKALGPVVAALMFGLHRLSGWLKRRFGLQLGRFLMAPLHRRLAPRLRLLASGGARLDEQVGLFLESLGYQVLSGYGLVETASVATFNPPGAARMASAGKPPPGVELRIHPVADLETVGEDESGIGEVQIRGPIVFSGYANNPEANALAFTEDGWFRTGDLGRLDPDGYLMITGRLKEVIVLPGGKNVEPESVERHYGRHPLIGDIAVLEHHDRLVALIVPDLDAARTSKIADIASAIRVGLAECGRELPPYMRLSGFVLTREELPRNPLGKFQRHKLPAIHARAEGGAPPPQGPLSDEDRERLESPRGRALMAWLTVRFPDGTIHPDTAVQMNLGIDSLAWVELGLDLEKRLGLKLSADDAAGVLTVRDLLDLVEAAPAAGSGGEDRAVAEEDAAFERALSVPLGPGLRGLGVLLYGLNRLLVGGFLRLRLSGEDYRPRSGPVILAVNHQSDIDPLIVAASLPLSTLRETWWSADRQRVFSSRAGRLLARIAQLFPVDDLAPARSLDRAVRVLEEGRILVWFPESWRSPTGEIQPFRSGIGALVERSGATVIPCRIGGAIDVLPRHARLPRPGRVRCCFGPALSAEQLMADPPDQPATPPPGAAQARIAERIREAILALDSDGDSNR